MRPEYILLLIVSFFPFSYKLSFWSHFFWWGIKSAMETFKQSYHFWLFVEIPILIMSFVVLYDIVFEIILYNIVFYFMLIYNVFVFWKIFRWKNNTIKWNKLTLISIWILVLSLIPLFLYKNTFIYLILSILMIFLPVYFLLAQQLKNLFMNSVQKI